MRFKHLLLLAAFLPLSAVAQSLLPGTWLSNGTDGLALAGVIEINEDGNARLAPLGHEELLGTWATEGESLTFTMPPHGSVSMTYDVTDTTLTLTQLNGAIEVLSRAAPEDALTDEGQDSPELSPEPS